MAARPRARKRVFPLLRAPDGSAFQKCGTCGVSVAIALADIHDCEHKMEPKRFRGMVENKSLPKSQPRFFDQPRSAFRLFMEQFVENHQLNNLLMVERMGFEKWKSMNDSEKFPYVFHARVVDGYYKDTLRKEAEEIIKVDDEAESALVENLENNDDGDKAKGKVTFIDSDWEN